MNAFKQTSYFLKYLEKKQEIIELNLHKSKNELAKINEKINLNCIKHDEIGEMINRLFQRGVIHRLDINKMMRLQAIYIGEQQNIEQENMQLYSDRNSENKKIDDYNRALQLTTKRHHKILLHFNKIKCEKLLILGNNMENEIQEIASYGKTHF